jgi:hypothetical protein
MDQGGHFRFSATTTAVSVKASLWRSVLIKET